MRSYLALAAFALFSNACLVVVDDHHSGAGGPVPSGSPVYRILPNTPTVVQAGLQAGYGITANTSGGYRLVWTGDGGTSGTYREFWGSVWTTGTFTIVTQGCVQGACPLEFDDYVSPVATLTGGQRIDFDAFATTGIDGFDFAASPDPIYFDLLIDGKRYPNLVFFPATDNGGQISNVGASPFGLTTK